VFPDLGLSWRVALAVAWLGGQGALIATGAHRPDGSFAFRMFPESSTVSITLSRDVGSEMGHGTVNVPVRDGEWLARDTRGVLHRFRWDDRVKDSNLYPWGRPIHASYGAGAQLDRLAHALEDVATHIDDDADTVRLVADITVRKNGGHPEHVRLESSYRAFTR
jgi:hypothetical protein